MSKRDQICVNVDPDLRRFYERQAELTNRTLSGQIRHVLTQVARVSQKQDGDEAAA